jgi:hypothetical protein
MKYSFDINLDPFTGAIGQANGFDTCILIHKKWITFEDIPLSVTLMVYAKYGVLLLYLMALLYAFRETKYYTLPIIIYILYFVVENITFHEVQWRYMMPDTFIALLCGCVGIGTLGAMYVAVDLIKQYRLANLK